MKNQTLFSSIPTNKIQREINFKPNSGFESILKGLGLDYRLRVLYQTGRTNAVIRIVLEGLMKGNNQRAFQLPNGEDVTLTELNRQLVWVELFNKDYVLESKETYSLDGLYTHFENPFGVKVMGNYAVGGLRLNLIGGSLDNFQVHKARANQKTLIFSAQPIMVTPPETVLNDRLTKEVREIYTGSIVRQFTEKLIKFVVWSIGSNSPVTEYATVQMTVPNVESAKQESEFEIVPPPSL